MIILVGGEKGGSGKSTLSQNLSVFFSKEFELDVMLVDADQQNTTADWRNERSKNPKLSLVHGAQASHDIRAILKDFNKRYDVVLVDCGGFDSEELRSGMCVADICLFPFRPKRRDLKTLNRILKLIALSKPLNENCKYFAIMSQCPSLPNQKIRIEEARELCIESGLNAFSTYTEMRNAYDDSDEQGLSVLEHNDEKAKQELLSIGHELIDRGQINVK